MAWSLRPLLVGLFLLTLTSFSQANSTEGDDLSKKLRSQPEAWLVMDLASNTTLAQKNQDERINPDDLVHLMTLFTALEILQGDAQRLQEAVSIDTKTVSLLVGTQRLYMVPGETQPLETLLKAIAVMNAEDAALAVAEHLGGSIENFVELMNTKAREIGLEQSSFTWPIARHDQQSTVRDIAKLCSILRDRYSATYHWFKLEELDIGTNTFRNRNPLLWKAENIEGVISSNNDTTFITHWHRVGNSNGDMQRDILSVLVRGKNTATATNDVLTLLRFGRTNYESIKLFDAGEEISTISVLMGNQQNLSIGPLSTLWVTVPRSQLLQRGTGGLSSTLEYLSPAIAPIKRGQVIATLHVFFEGKHIEDFPLYALHDIGPGSFVSRFIDYVLLRIQQNPDPTSNLQPSINESTK